MVQVENNYAAADTDDIDGDEESDADADVEKHRLANLTLSPLGNFSTMRGTSMRWRTSNHQQSSSSSSL